MSSSADASRDVTGSPPKSGLSKGRFEEIYGKGLIERSAHFTLRALPGDGRRGTSTAKKLGSIARRNKAKRRATEAAKDLIPRNLDCVISVSSKADRLPFREIRAELEELFARMATRWEGASESS